MTAAPRTYAIRTLGCQMNLHDSEHMAGVLEAAGYTAAPGGAIHAQGIPQADVVVFNTCAVRESAAERLFGNLGQLRAVKLAHPGMQIAVGGCLAQKDRTTIIERAPWVDVVFGTHNLGALPVLLERARHNQQGQAEFAEALTVFPSSLPAHRASSLSAWVSISVGCNNTCTFCIVPSLRGRERDRPPADVLTEVSAVVADGAVEITLLGQNVNSYGAEFGDRSAFARLLRSAGTIPGLERLRFTSPHPAAFSDDVIAAMAETPAVMPQLHMPAQAGSDRVLRAMRRSYRVERFLAVLERVRQAMPEAAISSDLIVGFPGETEADFEATLDLVRAARFASAFTFQFSPRPGTPAAAMPDQVPPELVAERFGRLVALQDQIAWEENSKLIGQEVEVLVADGQGRKDQARWRVSGRARDGRLVHLGGCRLAPSETQVDMLGMRHSSAGSRQAGVAGPFAAESDPPSRLPDQPNLLSAAEPGSLHQVMPGDLVRAVVTAAAPHHLMADSAVTGGLFEVTFYASRRPDVGRRRPRVN
ncbi:MAG: tRNA (N6-isopentenyl adenosine(37)-C2)-methylthiotransferase MiaB [Bifidobacteriaceae bacterium]|jgi:tRNA-2-methylthio-N6-dimethylallyladenosine synthase|nr:tRNA (N6-isopentenyl adenosine(37)-C2)-methylthiotransferase MiaB [Bifidobacteriaceae bacterium]